MIDYICRHSLEKNVICVGDQFLDDLSKFILEECLKFPTKSCVVLEVSTEMANDQNLSSGKLVQVDLNLSWPPEGTLE